ncbi:MAG: hypothetical protein ACREQK_19005 [Candidatus Binatia bacterium]
MRKNFFASLSCAIALLLGTGERFPQTPPQKITMSYSSTGMTSIQLFIARDKRMFREEGIEPLLVRMSANTAIAAGIAGELGKKFQRWIFAARV